MTGTLVISPHLDDAVLSAGASLHALATTGVPVTVVTLFAGIPKPPFSAAARALHEQCGHPTALVERRREEDARALAHLGVALRHEDFHDAVYRRSPSGDWLIGAGDSLVDAAAEPELHRTLVAHVGELIRLSGADKVLTCAAIGGHIDHRHARDAVLAATGPGVAVELWEDLPYGAWSGAPPPSTGTTLGPPAARPAGPASWSAKWKAVECYASQLELLSSGGDVRRLLDVRAQVLGRRLGRGVRAESFRPVSRSPDRTAPGSPTPPPSTRHTPLRPEGITLNTESSPSATHENVPATADGFVGGSVRQRPPRRAVSRHVPDGSRLDAVAANPDLTALLREGIDAGLIGGPWIGGRPRYVWRSAEGVVSEFRLEDPDEGLYAHHGLHPSEWPEGVA